MGLKQSCRQKNTKEQLKSMKKEILSNDKFIESILSVIDKEYRTDKRQGLEELIK